jgi:hypothetical protein
LTIAIISARTSARGAVVFFILAISIALISLVCSISAFLGALRRLFDCPDWVGVAVVTGTSLAFPACYYYVYALLVILIAL